MPGMDATEGVSHLQAAARELVAAARSFLDVVEEVVNDDDRLAEMVEQVTDTLRGAADAVTETGSRFGARRSEPVEHITVE